MRMGATGYWFARKMGGGWWLATHPPIHFGHYNRGNKNLGFITSIAIKLLIGKAKRLFDNVNDFDVNLLKQLYFAITLAIEWCAGGLVRFARQCACHVASVRGWQCMASGPVIFRSDTGESWCLVITDIVQIVVVTTPGYRDIVRIYYLYNVSFGTNIVTTNIDNS